ncbi:MmcQ/YjbR family DNA-binding protein [Acinetobacter sp. S40]|uniref:MmcQ/YjbR family DNA-binding protein n=1 Tax=unclassified Acinetobacter TaxID=196816 RepID=UPI00190C531E|nr:MULTISPECIES: MmcQ/YjbR family DNA-binding protein [unclassified Acinetobacter]MBJ9985510.1 MmcQ/YjbR family DNA-binding protein [Acinetobacter sp. S40]MBK0064543.1 MmcQ/YjbR family DNA-binding protein [Acinetobacter sp. S55]MBK0067910.1 MmcQ/YjbR family DNA-binding protein [Acinetobacter sp. S54]
MNAAKIQQLALKIALEQPEAELSHPFGPQCNVIKVFDKMFMLTGEINQQKFINLKIEPDQAEELKELYPSIKAGYHMNKKHWISIFEGQNIDAELIQDLVKSSYVLVVSKLNKTQKMRLKLQSGS